MSQAEYYINPVKYAGAFAVPAEVVDRHIRLAGAAQLKVLLHMLRHGGACDAEATAEALRMSLADVKDSLQYWLEAEIVLKTGEREKPATSAEPAQTRTEPAPAKIKAVALPTREEVARRGAESKEIEYLLTQAQLKFGRIINHAEAATLVWLHDYEGLPVSVILMIIEYAVSRGKTSIKYIEKIGMDWAAREIDSLAKAEARLMEMDSREKAWRTVESAFGIERRRPGKREEEYAYRWVEEWGFSKEMLRAAYEICVDNTAKISMPYIHKILEKWHKNNIKTLKDLEKDAKPEPAPGKAGQSSLDIGEVEDMIRRGVF